MRDLALITCFLITLMVMCANVSSTLEKTECVDGDEVCADYDVKLCDTTWMKTTCLKKCGKCGGDEKHNDVTHKHSHDCEDQDWKCKFLSTYFCNHSWMHKHCRQKCSLCHTKAKHGEFCDDDHKDCGQYGDGLCDMEWGQKNCQVRCGLCD